MHILLRYYESSPHKSREDRVKETLQTMGVSILLGGLTTFLGVIPLALSSMKIFLPVFYSFLAMVILGVAHGLVLLPVILSLVGPTMAVRGHHLAPSPDTNDHGHVNSNGRRDGGNHAVEERDTIVQPAKTLEKERVNDWDSTWCQNVSNEIEC